MQDGDAETRDMTVVTYSRTECGVQAGSILLLTQKVSRAVFGQNACYYITACVLRFSVNNFIISAGKRAGAMADL
jgi:hypothetical protein